MKAEHLIGAQCRLGEGPVWNADEGALYWVDIEQGALHRFRPATGRHDRFDVGLPVGALAFRSRGGLVLATRDGFAFWDVETGRLELLSDPEAGKEGSRFNDGAVDSAGRFWAGTLREAETPTSALYRLDPDRSVHTMETGLSISNGIGWSPDDRTMYLTDSPLGVIYAYDYDPATGSIEGRRTFARVPDGEGVPDGLAVDSEGFVWSAVWGGWKVNRYDPDGKVEREVRLPVAHVTSCAFGGDELRDLFITTAWKGLGDEERRRQPLAGDVFRAQTTVRGLPRPSFAG